MRHAPDTNAPLRIHPLTVRITHWLNAMAIFLMVTSGWRIYNASPILDFNFPNAITLGGWLAGALQWHFAAMWLFGINSLVYLLYGIFTGHFKHSLFPLSPRTVLRDLNNAVRGRLVHELGVYNAVQRVAYLGVILLLVLLLLSGLSIWKPVQFQVLAALFGGYGDARRVHFFAMSLIVFFVAVHIAMVTLVPKTFLPMCTGRAKRGDRPPESV